MPCRDVDVNLHPTKKEVGFVQQEELVELVRSAVEGALLASNNSRSFTQQTLSQHVGLPAFGGGAEEDGGDNNAAPPLKTDGTRVPHLPPPPPALCLVVGMDSTC